MVLIVTVNGCPTPQVGDDMKARKCKGRKVGKQWQTNYVCSVFCGLDVTLIPYLKKNGGQSVRRRSMRAKPDLLNQNRALGRAVEAVIIDAKEEPNQHCAPPPQANTFGEKVPCRWRLRGNHITRRSWRTSE